MKPPAGDTDHAHFFIRSRPSSEFVRWSKTYRVACPPVTYVAGKETIDEADRRFLPYGLT